MMSGSRALVGDIGSARRKGNTARQCIHEWEAQDCRDGQEQEVRLILIRKQGWDLITSEFECGMEVQKSCECDNSGCHDSGLARVCQQMSHECYGT